MKKLKLVVPLLILFVLSLGVTNAKAYTHSLGLAETSIYIIDGENQYFNNRAIIENGVTLVPIRSIFEPLRANVLWNGKDQTITVTKGDTTLSLKIGSKDAKVNERNVTLSVPAKIKNSTTFVPIRFISESLGKSVHWDGPTKSVMIGTLQEHDRLWVGDYFNKGNYSDQGYGLEEIIKLDVYKKTADTVYIVGNYITKTMTKMPGYYSVEAKLTSNTTASSTNNSCNATFELVKDNIQVSSNGKCEYLTLFDEYYGNSSEK